MTTTDDDLREMIEIVRTLQSAGKLYRASRNRFGVYDFLAAVYAIYWVLKRRGSVGRQKALLKRAGQMSAAPSKNLSSLILFIASKQSDRRDRYRWKRMLEVAFNRRIDPRAFKKELQDLRGVNGALAQWSAKPQSPNASIPSCDVEDRPVSCNEAPPA